MLNLPQGNYMNKNAWFGFIFFAALIFGVYWLISSIWEQFTLLDEKIAVAALTAFSTVTVSTITIVVGKYYERKKDIEAHYRTKKTEIYDEFLKKLFETFFDSDTQDSEQLVTFLREWQRKVILWGGQDVLVSYLKWMQHLKKGNPDADSIFFMEELFKEIRKDLGHKSSRLGKGTFAHLLLTNSELFLEMAAKNPKLTMAELVEVEKLLNK